MSMREQFCDCIGAVSYTHLDVYKRQVVEHCSRGIIWHQDTGYTTKVLIHVNVSGDPRTLLLVDESLYKWILAVCHNAHKEEGWNDLAGIWIDDLRRIPCPVNFDLFAGLSVDMHGCAALLLILLDVITELGIHERLIAGLAAFLQVLRPEEFLVDTVAVQLLLDVVEIDVYKRQDQGQGRDGDHL